MDTPSLLITFDDAAQLEDAHRDQLSAGRAYAPGEYELTVGDRCQVVLVHPESGDAMEVNAEVASVDGDGVGLRFAVTPLVRSRLDKLVGVAKGGDTLRMRVRGLSGGQRRQMALTGDLNERTMLERTFGNEVWEPLLENPRLTVGEVVRLARMGAMPIPLLEKIVANNAWVKVPQIRRALLTHPRLDGGAIQRLLRFTPMPELKLMPSQTAYSAQVRAAARKLLGPR